MEALAKRGAMHFYPLKGGHVLAVFPSPTAWTYVLLGRQGGDKEQDWESWPTRQWKMRSYRVCTQSGTESPLGVCAFIEDRRGGEIHRIYLAHEWDAKDWADYRTSLEAGASEVWVQIDGDAWPAPTDLPTAGPECGHRQPGSRRGKARRRRKWSR